MVEVTIPIPIPNIISTILFHWKKLFYFDTQAHATIVLESVLFHYQGETATVVVYRSVLLGND